jgi:HAD superfamily hydrolase (TIGR01509 family)
VPLVPLVPAGATRFNTLRPGWATAAGDARMQRSRLRREPTMAARPTDQLAPWPDRGGGEPAGHPPLQALLWDVDGTLAETELDGHRLAFNLAFADEGLPWRWDEATYLQLLAVSGGRERLRAFLSEQEGRPADAERIERLQSRKQAHYSQLLGAGAVALREGVQQLIEAAAAAGLRQGIVTTSSRQAVEALLATAPARLAEALPFWICGEDVARKKPDPQAYHLAQQHLGLPAATILVIEDSRNGLRAASAAGLPCLVTLSRSSRNEAGPDGCSGLEAALAVLDGLGAPARPLRVLRGPACPGGLVTLAWLQQLHAGS